MLFYLLMAPVAALAGFVRGASGFGGPIILVPALQFFLAPLSSVTTALVADLLANFRLVPQAVQFGRRKVLIPLLGGGLIGIPIGLLALSFADASVAKRIVSAILVASALLLLSGWRLPRPPGQIGLGAAGIAGGASLSASGISLIVSLVLHASDAPPKESRANFVLWAFAGTAVAVFLLAVAGMANQPNLNALREAWLPTLVLTPIYFLGVSVGVTWSSRLNEAALRVWTLRAAALLAGIGLF